MSKAPVHHIHHKHRVFTYKLLAATTLLILFVLFLVSFSPLKKFTYNLQPTTHNLPRVPEPNDRNSKGTAIPNATVEPVLGATGKMRIFTVTAQDSRLSHQQIVVYEGDIVRINFSAHDDDIYDFTIPNLGISQQARNGETKIVEFQATSIGSYDFICSKCKTKGTLVVVPKA